MTARRLPKLSEVKLTRRTLVAGGAALVAAGAGVVVGVTRCSRGAADVPVEPTAGVEGSEDAANSKLGGKLSLYTSCPEELVNAGVARFSQDAGVTVAVTRGGEAELVGQLLDGDVAGKPAADVIWGGEALWYAGVDGASSGLEPVELPDCSTPQCGALRCASSNYTHCPYLRQQCEDTSTIDLRGDA